MSRIYFHSKEKDVEVRGSERSHAANLAKHFLLMGLGFSYNLVFNRVLTKQYLKIIPECYLHGLKNHSDDDLTDSLITWLSVGYEGDFLVNNEKQGVFDTALNTIMQSGSDSMVLMGRLHGQCECHAWVDGANRCWLADIIQEGLTKGIMRSGMGWESVIEFLKSSDVDPVVTSYSVCDSFPNRYMALMGDDDLEDVWYSMSDIEQWDKCIQVLRSDQCPYKWTEINPETFRKVYFGRGINAFQVHESLDKL